MIYCIMHSSCQIIHAIRNNFLNNEHPYNVDKVKSFKKLRSIIAKIGKNLRFQIYELPS